MDKKNANINGVSQENHHMEYGIENVLYVILFNLIFDMITLFLLFRPTLALYVLIKHKEKTGYWHM